MASSTTPRPRPKRATTPLDATSKARLTGRRTPDTARSGSEHEAALSGLVHDYFLERSLAAGIAAEDSDAEDERRTGVHTGAASYAAEEIRCLLDSPGNADAFRLLLVADVMEAMQSLTELRKSSPAFRRAVMARLREGGHDAGLCRSQWEKSSSLVAGSYEYIDVVTAAGAEYTRYVVDVGFAAVFEVARPTEEYEAVRSVLPDVLVARAVEARAVVVAAVAEARRSLKSRGLSVPPWRKRRFMMAKWFGPYRRTVSAVPTLAGAAVGCRTVVGFVVPPAMTAGLWS